MKVFEKIALERMYRLIELAQEETDKSKEYIQLLEKISTKNRVKVPFDIKIQFCKKCKCTWKDGKTVRKRIKGKALECTCLQCGYKKLFNIQKKE